MSEKRLFYRDPSTGTETPLLVYQVDTTAVSRLQIDKQDKADDSLNTTSKTVVGAINEIHDDVSHCIHEPYEAGLAGQALTCDGDGNYFWKDSSAVHDISPNQRDYTITLGNEESTHKQNVQVGLPNDVNSILDNLTTHLIVKDTSAADVQCYNKMEMDYVMTELRNDVSLYENQTGLADEFDPYVEYHENDIVRHEGFFWRCLLPRFQGAWNPAGWRQTTLLEEIKDIRGVTTNVETLTVNVSVNRGEGVVAGTTITIVYDSGTGKQPETVTLDETGKAVFFLDYGDRYYIEGSGIEGYLSPRTQILVAGIPKRVINLTYKMLGSGLYVIDENGIETDIELWDPADNPQARFIKFTNNQLCPGGLEPDNSIIISKLHPDSIDTSRWQIERKDLPSLQNLDTAVAEADFNGLRNCQLALSDCTTPNSAGKTFVDLYNEEQRKQDPSFIDITIHEYLPAIHIATSFTESFGGEQLHGYLPSMGQLRMLCDNRADITNALNKIGAASVPNYVSGYWWSSTENSANFSWLLYNGTSTFGGYKDTNILRILVLFAIE